MLALRVLLLLIGAALCGCGGDDGLELRRWTLDGELATTPGVEVELPAHLDGIAARAGTYRLATRVELPARWHGAPLTLVVVDVAAIAHLTVDGEVALATDPPAGTAYRSRGPLGWRIPADATGDGVLELSFAVEHRWTQSGWWTTAPVLVAGDDRPAAAFGVLFCNLYVALAAVISLVQLGLTSLLVYLVDRKRRAYLWFAIQNFSAAYYPLFVLGVTQSIFGVYDVVVLAASLIGAMLASVYFTHQFFDLRPPWRGWPVMWALCMGAVAVFHDPFHATLYAGPVVIAAAVALTGYQLVVCGRLALRHPDRFTARLQFASWVALALSMPPDLLHWLGQGDPLAGARPASLGLLFFGLCLSLLLGRRHIMSLQLEARHLEESRAEVELLNVELRRQIAERSTQLFAALAVAGGRSNRAPELAAGELVHARYTVVRELGRGGMGTVYEVERVSDGRRLALKLTHELTGLALARLAREALIASKIAHRNLVGVIDVDVAASGFLYVVMELVDGTTLKALRSKHGDPAWALPLLAQIADGLAALHRAGVVHRDLKPANVMIATAADGTAIVKITDFGVSRHLPGVWGEDGGSSSAVETGPLSPFDDPAAVDLDGETQTGALAGAIGDSGSTVQTAGMAVMPRRQARVTASSEVTRTGMLVGTPAYIAPELIEGPEALSPAADLFAFGVLAWELLTGEKPFVKPAALSKLHGREPEPPPPLGWRWPGHDPAVASAIDRCLFSDPAARPTAAEVARVLARFLR